MKNKSLSTGKKLLVMLAFAISTIFLGILLSFFIRFMYLGITTHDNESIKASLIFFIFPCILGLIFYKTLMILLRDYDRNKKEKDRKWYIDKFLIALMPVWITVAVVILTFCYEDDEMVFFIFSIIIFVCIGIVTTPNVVKYALNDMKDWKNILYKNGNLSNNKKVAGFYKMSAPVPFERKIYFTVLKEQILNINVVLLFIAFFIGLAVISNSFESTGVSGNIFYAVVSVKAERAAGLLFFGAVFLSAFWIPMLAYYITNAVYKLRIIKRHEYIVYHAIVNKVDTFKIRINNRGVHFSYDYCSCVGIKSKNVNNTKAILIFIPDDMLLFPDLEE